MQEYEVQMLRNRLENQGYKNIHISVNYRDGNKFIVLSCVKPILGTVLSVSIPFSHIRYIP